MNRLTAILVIILALVGTNRPLQAQSDTKPPYLYYYSQLLGGLIIERADGSDSRQIAADVIPPNMTGLAGPGWSPSGKYFAAYSDIYSDSISHIRTAYLFDTNGKPVAGWLHNVATTSMMQWSPSGEDLLLVQGIYSPDGLRDSFFWLIDVQHDQLLVDFGAHFGGYGFQYSDIAWDTAHQQIVFYYATGLDDVPKYYRVTMNFNGTTLREPVTAQEFTPIKMNIGDSTNLYNGIDTSPNGTYKAEGYAPAMLTNTRTGQVIALPRNTQATTCREYEWTKAEDYVITLDGNLIAGGGCGSAILGVTNPQGSLWRELGGCTWAHPPCVGWLPQQVGVTSLPEGASKPVQLDPVKIDYGGSIQAYDIDPAEAHLLNLHCNQDLSAALRDPTTKATLYTLKNIVCPYRSYDAFFPENGIDIVVAEDPVHHLLATYGAWSVGVTMWQLHDKSYEPILKLSTQGLTLEFTDHNERLRARNFNGWKIYSVADILAAATKPHE
ncbi:MAG: hypothetical protein ABI970_21695 [Chloroflexota bacterium]